MDEIKFELLLRQTPFCSLILSELWDQLNILEKIELLNYYSSKSKAVPEQICIKAVQDPNPIVRMLAAKNTYFFFKPENRELHQKLLEDSSLFVTSAMHVNRKLKDFDKLSQLEKLGVIALSSSIDHEEFANFISNSLQKEMISENDAADLVIEFVRNLRLRPLRLEEGEYFEEGLDWYSNLKQFEAIWNLTTCTPPKVHYVIASEYPLETGQLDDTFSEEMLFNMSEDAIEILVWRQYKPLLALIVKTPERFNNKIHDAVSQTKDTLTSSNPKNKGGTDFLIKRLSTEIQQRLDDLDRKLDQIVTKKRGWI
jgi:hypothetical protein